MRIIGIDPGLRYTGWGIIDKVGSSIQYISSGVISPNNKLLIGQRLAIIHKELTKVLDDYDPRYAVIEKTFVNNNNVSSLKLGEARGVILMSPSLKGIEVVEYSPNTIKKVVVGSGHADKEQVQKMIQMILPKSNILSKAKDVADALAIALCHAYQVREF